MVQLPPPGSGKLRSFIEERTGLFSTLESWKNASVPGGPRWGRAIGVCLTAILALQLVSGVALTFFYSPSTTNAWASINYLEREVPFGTVLRGLHNQGTNALFLLLALHLLHVVITAGYRRPREFTWWLGLSLLLLVFGAAMTGALLPWDDQGYWASRVEIGIMGTAPVVGSWIQQIALGGNDLGNLTLTRYFTVHAIVLPVLILAVVGAHVALVRRHGASGASGPRATPWWPGQPLRDSMVVFLGVGLLVWTASRWGAPLEAPADPTGGYPARPVWYFRALFELRRHFEGPVEPVATMVIPGLVGFILAALPFADRAATLRGRIPYVAAVLALGLCVIAGTWQSYARDAHDGVFQAQRADARLRADLARTAAQSGVPPEGALYMLQNTPEIHGRRLFTENCLGCHAVSGKGTEKPNGPDLGGYGSTAWLSAVIAHPEAPEFFGHTKVSGMDPYANLGADKLDRLASFLAALSDYSDTPPDELPTSLKAGLDTFREEGCDSCHSLTPGEASGATNLSGYGSEDWLTALMQDPGAETYFGKDNDMTAYKDKFSDRDFEDIVTYMRSLKDKPLKTAPAVASARP